VTRGPGYSLTAVLGLPPDKDPGEERAIAGAQRAAMGAIFGTGARGVVAAISDDYRVTTFTEDNARVVVQYSVKGQAVESQEVPISRFGAWVADAPDAQIHAVRPNVPPPTPLATYGIGHCDRFQCAVWDRRGTATLLMRRPLLGYFTTRIASGARLRDAINAVNRLADVNVATRPADGAAVAAGAAWQVLDDEAVYPMTPGEPTGNWFVTLANPPWTPIAYGGNPPLEGPSRFGRIKEAITTETSGVAYGRSRPGLPGSRERQLPLFEDAISEGYSGRSVSADALRERAAQHRARRRFGSWAFTLDEYRALSREDLLILNLVEWGRVAWQLELETSASSPQLFVAKYRGGRRSKYRIEDPTGDLAAALASSVVSLPGAAIWWTTAGMLFEQPFANAADVRGVLSPYVETAGAIVLDRWLAAGLTERQAVVLANSQAGWTLEEIHKALNIARATVAAHLAAGRKILREISKLD
jgi:hypothetical protein